jgi:sugar lactone lactonase YvrE
MQAERLTDTRFTAGESPVWRAHEQAVYWVDIHAQRIHRWSVVDEMLHSWTLPEKVACIAFSTGGKVIAGMETGLFSVELKDDDQAAAATLLAAPRSPMTGMRFNDGRCDRQGRFWSGTMSSVTPSPTGELYRYEAGRELSPPIVRDLVVSNGLAWSPDGRTMYLSDSHASRRLIWAFDFDIASGTPNRRRVFVDMSQHAGRPDGAAIDVDGCYWSSAVDAGRLVRFTPAGRLDRQIMLPVAKPSMCAFGGSRLDTLYVTTIRPRDAAVDADDGCVFVVRPGVSGCPEPEFAGPL